MWTYARWHADTTLHEHIMRHGMLVRACFYLDAIWAQGYLAIDPLGVQVESCRKQNVAFAERSRTGDTSFNHGSGAGCRFLGLASQQARGACFRQCDARLTDLAAGER